MKQFALVFFCALLLTGCNDEKNQYQELVFKLMENDQDLLDYSLDPDETTDCVVDTTGKKMPGLFSWDPRRAPIYTAYTDLIKFKLYVSELSSHTSDKDETDPNKKLGTLRETFGSAQALADAHSNFSESVLACFESLTSKSDPDNEKLF
ncbi:MAG: hypothetical protein P8L84_00760 [Methylococcaceae bacterium]|jgi:hypothetical protein|nr:hypothetical protein [Methylococcaceae bacterium]